MIMIFLLSVQSLCVRVCVSLSLSLSFPSWLLRLSLFSNGSLPVGEEESI